MMVETHSHLSHQQVIIVTFSHINLKVVFKEEHPSKKWLLIHMHCSLNKIILLLHVVNFHYEFSQLIISHVHSESLHMNVKLCK